MFGIKLSISDYKIQCVRKKVFALRKAPFCLCTLFAGCVGNREKKTTVFNQPLISKYKINFHFFVRHGSFVLLSLHFICLLPMYLVKDEHLRKCYWYLVNRGEKISVLSKCLHRNSWWVSSLLYFVYGSFGFISVFSSRGFIILLLLYSRKMQLYLKVGD
jgi:hypothetical protein